MGTFNICPGFLWSLWEALSLSEYTRFSYSGHRFTSADPCGQECLFACCSLSGHQLNSLVHCYLLFLLLPRDSVTFNTEMSDFPNSHLFVPFGKLYQNPSAFSFFPLILKSMHSVILAFFDSPYSST